jgi:hypothetical protein
MPCGLTASALLSTVAVNRHVLELAVSKHPPVGGAASPQTRSAYAARCTAPMRIDIYVIYVSAFIKRRVKRVLHLSKRSTLPSSKLCKAEIQFIKRRATQNRKPTPNPTSTKTTTTTPHATTHKQTTPTKPTQSAQHQEPQSNHRNI